ncbi:trypsin-3-like [Gigantopelta aegis]|uniref:trypsin-3-like n=1 Tax=Gigantopelta aegis TaxID=1735272 RepID=UPI001B889C72|nr:trypsin-3-like [Gigantopelta aegis]
MTAGVVLMATRDKFLLRLKQQQERDVDMSDMSCQIGNTKTNVTFALHPLSLSFTLKRIRECLPEILKVKSPDERLVGGQPTIPFTYPFMAAIQLTDGHHVCGGSLIDSLWVISAAHCYTDTNIKDLQVVLGDHQRSVSEGTEQIFSISEIKMHPFYSETHRNGYFLPNDLALLKLSRPALLNGYAATIDLPHTCPYNITGRRCRILGWGRLNGDDLSVSDVLQEATVSIHSLAECRLTWGNYTYHGHICTFEPNVSSCAGVSGGPLICLEMTGYVLGGVSSWTDTQCHDFHSIYMDVSQEAEWVDALLTLPLSQVFTLPGCYHPPKFSPSP